MVPDPELVQRTEARGLCYNMVMLEIIPSEDDEEAALCDYCELMHYNHWHVPNETYTPSWAQKQKNKRLGVHSGVSDHWVRVSNPTKEMLFVLEMKRQKGNTPTPKQIEFIRNMNKMDNVYACCCYGADEAIQVIQDGINGDFTLFYQLLYRMDEVESKRNKNGEKRRKSGKNTKILPKNGLPY